MKKSIYQSLGFVSVGLLLGSVLSPSTMTFAEEEKIQLTEYTKEANELHQKTTEAIQQANKTGDIADIRKAYQLFIKLTPELLSHNYQAHISGDKMDTLYFEVREMLYKKTPEKYRNDEIVRFAKEWKEVLKEQKNLNSIYQDHFAHFIDKNTIKAIQPKLDGIYEDWYRYAKGIWVDGKIVPLPTVEEMEKLLKEYVKKVGPAVPDPEKKSIEEKKKEIADKYPQNVTPQLKTKQITYKKIGSDWYEITQTIRDGKVIQEDKRKLNEQESYVFRVRENPNYGLPSNNSNIQYVSEKSWNHYTIDQNPESKWTIHYSVNKDEVNPYYYDTGIRVSEQKSISYEQYKDVLLIIVDKMGGYLVEDKGKFLVVVEGKPIVVEKVKATYSKRELESLFNSFEKVEIRIMETTIGKAGSLEEQLVSKQVKSIRVNGEEFKLQQLPIIRNDRVLLPLREVVDALGGTLSEEGITYIAKKGKNTAVYKEHDVYVHINGKAIYMASTPVKEKETLFVSAAELATTFGYEMIWDAETGSLSFEES